MSPLPLQSDFIEVALADDHILFRQALKIALSLRGNINITIEASTNFELISKLAESKKAIILLDIYMPDLNSCINTIEKIQEEFPEAKILILTMCNDEYIESQLLKYGVFSFIHKSENIDQLIGNIRKASLNISHSRDISSNENRSRKGELANKKITFSEKEIEILKLIGEGKTNKEITRKIFLSLRSIEQIMHNMRERIDAKNTPSLIKFATDNKII
jgi:DNA-binding NarL/FixJ family response regulator